VAIAFLAGPRAAGVAAASRHAAFGLDARHLSPLLLGALSLSLDALYQKNERRRNVAGLKPGRVLWGRG
jgi:hypothetical protein